MKRFRNIALALVVISFFLVVAVCTFYNINMAKVSNDNTLKEVTIKAGSINSIANTLKENNLLALHIYLYSVSRRQGLVQNSSIAKENFMLSYLDGLWRAIR